MKRKGLRSSFPMYPYSYRKNAGSDTDDNQNYDIIQPSDNDGNNEAEQLINFDECQDHDPEMIIHRNKDPSSTLNYPSKTRKWGRTRPREAVSHASPTHALKRAHTSAGRKIIIPSRFIESIELYKMGAKCEYCGVEYANRRNFKRHVNATHSENVKYVAYCIDICDRIFFAGSICSFTWKLHTNYPMKKLRLYHME